MQTHTPSVYQIDLWTAARVANNDSTYNLVYSYVLNTAINIFKFKESADFLASKFEDLRSSFSFQNSSLKVNFFKSITPCIEYVECTGVEYYEIIHNFANTKFNLSIPPLWKILIIKLSDGSGELWFNFHHIIADGNSVQSYINFFINAFSRKTDVKEIDSVVFSENVLKIENSEIEKKYMEKLGKHYLNTSIHYAYKGNAVEKNSNRAFFSVSSELANISEKRSTSKFNLYMSAFSIVISRILDKKHFVISYPKNCRLGNGIASGYAVTSIPIVALEQICYDDIGSSGA
jgi:hypothetical protein